MAAERTTKELLAFANEGFALKYDLGERKPRGENS